MRAFREASAGTGNPPTRAPPTLTATWPSAASLIELYRPPDARNRRRSARCRANSGHSYDAESPCRDHGHQMREVTADAIQNRSSHTVIDGAAARSIPPVGLAPFKLPASHRWCDRALLRCRLTPGKSGSGFRPFRTSNRQTPEDLTRRSQLRAIARYAHSPLAQFSCRRPSSKKRSSRGSTQRPTSLCRQGTHMSTLPRNDRLTDMSDSALNRSTELPRPVHGEFRIFVLVRRNPVLIVLSSPQKPVFVQFRLQAPPDCSFGMQPSAA